ncbi:MAG: DinB family protein [Flammeovirgaceae bacterium]|nr:DinB family protein [Flammeovirgaceae bacterium]
MKISLLTLTLIFGLLNPSKGQTKTDEPSKVPVWTEADRKYLLDNLIRSKEEIFVETKNLTKEQWNFKESPDRWSINQIVEHICLWELIQMNEISVALNMGPMPDFPQHLPDSIFINQDPKRLKKEHHDRLYKTFHV